MSKEGVLSVNTGGGATIETLSGENGPHTPPNGHNFNFSGSVAGGSATNGAIIFETPGGPGHNENGQMDVNVQVDGTTIDINASNQLHVIGGVFSEQFTLDASTPPGTNPVVPDGSGNINITGGQVAAGTTANVIRTDSLAANSYTIQVQRSQAVASSTVGDNGVSHFNSAEFTVDANGFVSLTGGGSAIESIAVQTGTSPIVPTAGGLVTINGASVAAGTNPVRSDGTGPNTLAIEVQRAQAIASTNATNVGLAAFHNTRFTVDANGFVDLNGSGVGETITGDTGGALSPIAGNWNIITNVAALNAGSSVAFAGSGSTLTLNVTDSTDNTYVGLQSGIASAGSAENSGFGFLALANCSAHVFNCGFGAHALQLCNSDANSAFGRSSLSALTSGIQQSAFGQSSLAATQTSTGNSGFGYATLINYLNGTGFNTAIGHQALEGLLTGDHNIGLGPSAGINYIGSESNNIVIANAGVAAESAVIRIGTTGTHTSAYCAGIAGVSVSNLNLVTINTSTGQLGSESASALGAITTITGNTGGAESPSAGNFNIVGTGSITVAGSANTETVQLTGLTNHAVLVGAGTATMTKIGPTSTVGQVLQSAGSSADPAFSTATYPLTTTSQQILYSTANNVVGELTTANSKLPATNSSGTLAMRAFSVVTQVFTGSGTYTPTSGMLYCKVRMVGGGAAGGGAAATGAAQGSVGSGGGSGEYAEATVSAATIGASQTVTIGTAGTANSGATGGNGGNTSLGAIVAANGGSGGITSAAGVSGQVNGGAGGTGGSGGSFRANGQHGTQAYQIVSTSTLIPGDGGNSHFGSGGQGSTAITAGTGAAGTIYGSGGGGSGNTASLTAKLGGAGTAGIMVIDEYVIA